MRQLKRVCVYCGSSPGADPAYRATAEGLGTLLAAEGIGLVYGGGDVGLMGVVADAVMAAGGEVIGVIPQALADREVAHHGLTELRVVASMHERKQLMADLADGFVALPGGVGTLEELVEMMTWLQLGIHHKPVSILDVGGFYTPLVTFFDAMVTERFMQPQHRANLIVDDDAAALLGRLRTWEPATVDKWLDRSQS